MVLPTFKSTIRKLRADQSLPIILESHIAESANDSDFQPINEPICHFCCFFFVRIEPQARENQ